VLDSVVVLELAGVLALATPENAFTFEINSVVFPPTSTTTTQGDLPNVGHYDNTTAQTTTGSLATFANLAKGLFADGSYEANIIDTIMSLSSNANVEDIEIAVQNDKIIIAKAATDANATATDTATDANATATDTATNTNSDTTTTTKPVDNGSDLPNFGH